MRAMADRKTRTQIETSSSERDRSNVTTSNDPALRFAAALARCVVQREIDAIVARQILMSRGSDPSSTPKKP